MNTKTWIEQKKKHKKWVMVTAYDTPTAEILDEAGVDLVLVGDSLGMVVLGYTSTAAVTMDEMIHHAKAARRGIKKAFLIADMPLKGLEKGPSHALKSAKRFMKESHCDAVKLEWGQRTPEILNALTRNNIPVMGHVGLTPQTVDQKKGFRVQGENAQNAFKIYEQAQFFEKHGAFSVLLECIPDKLSKMITGALSIPTIGIGAGPACDGQVLVFHDLVGLFSKFKPRHVKRFAEGEALFGKAVSSFIQEVRSGTFPDKKHSFKMNAAEWASLKNAL